jgi:thiamine-phosphate diphosphorylase/hydroxyethylthiazole kinase
MNQNLRCQRDTNKPSQDLATVRKILGPHAIIGVTCSSIEEARSAALGGATYLGIGTIFATST